MRFKHFSQHAVSSSWPLACPPPRITIHLIQTVLVFPHSDQSSPSTPPSSAIISESDVPHGPWDDPRQRTPRTLHARLWGGSRMWVLGQRPKMSLNGEPLGAGLHSIYTILHEGYARLSMRLCTVQSYVSDVIVELRLCRMTSRETACTAWGTGLD